MTLLKTYIRRSRLQPFWYIWATGEDNVRKSYEADEILRSAGIIAGSGNTYTFPDSRLAEAIAVLRFNGFTNIEVEE